MSKLGVKIIFPVLAIVLTFLATPMAAFSGSLDINAGEFSINAGSLTEIGDVNIAAGATLINAGLLNLSGNWVVNSSGSFIDTGTVTLNGSGVQSLTCGGVDASHDFNNITLANASAGGITFSDALTTVNFTCNIASSTLNFNAGSIYTVSGTLTLNGQAMGTEIKLRSLSSPTRWTFAVTGGEQQVNFIDLKDSNASSNNILASNSLNSGNNDDTEPAPHWIFGLAAITFPQDAKTVGRQPTIIGVAEPSDTVDIYALVGGISTKVASVTVDSNGNFRVKQSDYTQTLDLGANSLTPKIGAVSGTAVNITVVTSPTTTQVPTITTPVNNSRIKGVKPTIIGQGKASQTVRLYASDANGNLLLSNAASSTVDAAGNYTINLSDYTVSLPKGRVYLNVTVDGVNSLITTIVLADPYGVVFDSVSDAPISGAVVSIYDSAGNILVPGVAGAGGCRIDALDSNPQTVGADGSYNYLADAASGYSLSITSSGYSYPSTKTSFSAGRVIISGSKGELFNVGTAIIQMDQPMDPQLTLLKLTKNANKKEVTIGDILTYSVQIQNLTGSDVSGVYIEDRIPPGFKYLKGKVVLDGRKIADPTGDGPVTFNIGNVIAGSTATLKYQLVVGSGVTTGSYSNQAQAKYLTGVVISNIASKTVKVIRDPLFDLGTIIGKVFWDWNKNGIQDPPSKGVIEKGVANVRIAMEDGTVVTTDSEGKFHLPMINPGVHIFRLDERSLPPGAYLTTKREEILNITNGLLSKVNFGVAYKKEGENGIALSQAQSSINIVQDNTTPKPRLNISLFEEALLLSNARLKEPAEFHIFTNYSLFIKSWKLEIFDKEIKRLVDTIEGDNNSIFGRIIWDGLDARGKIIRPDRVYTYKLTVYAENGRFDITKEKEFRVMLEQDPELISTIFDSEKEIREKKEKRREWMAKEDKANNLDKQNIILDGEMVKVYSPKAPLKKIKIRKGDKVIEEIVSAQKPDSAKDILGKISQGQEHSELAAADIIIPRGKYTIEAETGDNALGKTSSGRNQFIADDGIAESATFKKEVSIGDDYFFLVGMGNLLMGGNKTKGNIEPVEEKEFKDEFYTDGRLAYYLKGKIKGKYLVTSSLDTDREQKELFKVVDPNKYYPVYGDASTINYEAVDTQGKFYCLIEWDKSQLKWGNYETGLNSTELSSYQRTLYGGKLNYESLSTTQFGDPNTKIIIFGASARQLAAHNEFIGTGGSLYYLKHQHITEGSEKIEIQVRDKINGLVLASSRQERGSDYQVNYDEGRIIFWRPVSYITAATSIISNQLRDGNSVYIVVDYEYEASDSYNEATKGGRVSQQLGDYARVGATYVKEEKGQENYELKGYDVTMRLGKNTKVEAEYATTISEEMNNFISTDGGISFSDIATDNTNKGSALSIKSETSLFDKVSLGTYYQRIEKGFSTAYTVSNQGTEKMGVRAGFNITPTTELNLWHDIQKITQDGNAQTQTQIGAKETQVTTAQLIQQLGKLGITSEYRRQRVKNRIEGIESETNTDSDILAAKFDYKISDKLLAFLKEEYDLSGGAGLNTTLGASFKPNDKLTISGSQTFGTTGSATELGAALNLTDKIGVYGGVKQTPESRVSSLGGQVKVDEKRQVYGTIAQEDPLGGGVSKQSVILGSKRKLNDDVEFRSERSFITSDKEKTSGATYGLSKEGKGRKLEGTLTQQDTLSDTGQAQSNIFGLSGEVNDKLAFSGAFEKGLVNNLDKTQTQRYATSLAGSYVEKDKLKTSLKLENRFDKAQEDTMQLLAYGSIEGKVTRDLTLFNNTNLSWTENLTANTTAAQYKEILTGFAYRPLYFDDWNIIGKYTYLENDHPAAQEDYQDVEKMRAHVFGLEGIYEINPVNRFTLKAAFKQNEEKVSGFDDYTRTQTYLGILRLDHRFFKDYELGMEYRLLRQLQADDCKQGMLLELDRYFGTWMKLGVGYNFTDFSDDLAHNDYTSYGWFVRVTASLGEAAYDLMRTKEETVKELKLQGEKQLDDISRLPPQEARIQEAIFYRDQARHWIKIGEYGEAYNCLQKGIKRSKELHLDVLREEAEKLARLSKTKMEEFEALNKKVRALKKKEMAKINKSSSSEEKRYLLLQLFYKTGKIYFSNCQYQEAIAEWEEGLKQSRSMGN